MRDWSPQAHQEPMLRWLAANAKCAIHSGPGSGKTSVVGTHIDFSLRDRMDTQRWLIVAPPMVAADTWAREFASWRHLRHLVPRLITAEETPRKVVYDDDNLTKRVDTTFDDRPAIKRMLLSGGAVDVCSYDTAVRVVNATGRNFPYQGVVLDESGFVRSKESERWKALNSAINKLGCVKYVIQLDGTPIPKGYEDLRAPFVLLDRGQRLGENLTEFREQWMMPDKLGYGGKVYSWKVRPEKLTAIQAKIGELAIASDRDIGVPVVTSVQRIALPPNVRKLYEQMKEEFLIEWDGRPILAANSAVKASKLVQLCNGFIFGNDSVAKVVHTAKLDAIVEAVEASPSPLLLPYLFEPEEQFLRKALGKRAVFASQKGALDKFRDGGAHCLAFHPGSMSHGIDGLQGVSNLVYWFGATYRYDWDYQIMKRLQRLGQKQSTVFVKRFIAAGTLEENILTEVLEPRGAQNAGLLEAISAMKKEQR